MIEADGLVKKYGSFTAVENISFSLEPGRILGFLGPNGAGKTTVMRMLAGYHFPDSGSIKIDGMLLDENSPGLKNHIGYLPENTPLYADMTPAEHLMFASEARLIPKKDRPEAVRTALELCGLVNHGNQRIETLSRGYRQRVGLAQAIVHDPSVLILDEPMTGLDPVQIIEIRDLIREMGKKKTIIMSTHILQEVRSVCTCYMILYEGKIASQGAMDQNEIDLEKIFIDLCAKKAR